MTDVTGNTVENANKSGISESEAVVVRFGQNISWSAFAPPLVFVAMLLGVSVLNSNYLGPPWYFHRHGNGSPDHVFGTGSINGVAHWLN